MARVRSTAWSEEARFAHTRIMVEVCPPELIPAVRQNMATGGVSIDWPDVCHCPVNGGPTLTVHKFQATCLSNRNTDFDIVEWCSCVHPEPQQAVNTMCATGDHVDGCPFDVCPLGTCHPMCSQVTNDGSEVYCHCACHG
jgi:hypothetical protein